MPRGGGGRRGGSPGGSRSFSSGRPSYSPPSPPRKQGQGPSYLKQAGAIAGGVVAGNLLTAAILGGARSSIPPDVRASCESGDCRIPDDDPCAGELRNFVQCAYRASEITECDGFNTLLKECRRMTGGYK